jgi:hypothetical protein
MKNTRENDLRILEALYLGNHLSQDELERASKLVYLLKVALKERI